MLEVAIEKQRRRLRVSAAFRLEAGGALGLFGASGAGKSTILRCVAGLEEPDVGDIAWNGKRWYPPPLPLWARNVGYVSQEPSLFPHLDVAGNVTFGLTGAERRNGGTAWLGQIKERLGLGECWHAGVDAISGGQARRVALARTLARRPALLLLDEPFSGLDRNAIGDLVAAITEWRRELGFALLAVDHQAEILRQLVPEVLLLAAGTAQGPLPWADVAL